MRNLRTFLIALLATVAATAIAFLLLDRPIAFYAHDHLAQYRIFQHMQRTPEFMVVLASIIFAVAGYAALTGRTMSRLLSALLLSGVSLGISTLIKDQLKFVFGRTWPETWINDNPSLIRDGVSGFNFFHGGGGYAAFPSGHTTATCAVISVLWISYPRYRPLYALIIAVVVVGLIGANYHYLSDIVAGGFLGWTTGWLAVVLWDRADLPRLRPEPPRRSATT